MCENETMIIFSILLFYSRSCWARIDLSPFKNQLNGAKLFILMQRCGRGRNLQSLCLNDCPVNGVFPSLSFIPFFQITNVLTYIE